MRSRARGLILFDPLHRLFITRICTRVLPRFSTRKESPQMSRTEDFDENFGTIDFWITKKVLMKYYLRLFIGGFWFYSISILYWNFFNNIYIAMKQWFMNYLWIKEIFNKNLLRRYLWNLEFMQYLYFCTSV